MGEQPSTCQWLTSSHQPRTIVKINGFQGSRPDQKFEKVHNIDMEIAVECQLKSQDETGLNSLFHVITEQMWQATDRRWGI